MQFTSWLLLASAASLTHGFYLVPASEDIALLPRLASSRLFASVSSGELKKRLPGKPKGPPDQKPKPICAPKKTDDHIKYQILNTTDVAIVEQQLMQFMSDPGATLENTGGSAGKIVTSNGVDGQACSFSHNPRHIDPNDMKLLWQAINCGSQAQPQMGWGYTSAFSDEGYYVGYGPTGQMPNCFDKEKDLKGSA